MIEKFNKFFLTVSDELLGNGDVDDVGDIF